MKRLTPAERMAICDRVQECPCWCGRCDLLRVNGWTGYDLDGKRHALTICDGAP